MDLQDLVNPMFHLELLLGKEPDDDDEKLDQNIEESQKKNQKQNLNDLRTSLNFNQDDESILKGFENYFYDLVECFSSFPRPEFCKITVQPLEK